MPRWIAYCGLVVVSAFGTVQACPLGPGEAGIYFDDSCSTSREMDFSLHQNRLQLIVTANIPENYSGVRFLIHWPTSLLSYSGGPIPGYDPRRVGGYAADCGDSNDAAWLWVASYGDCYDAGTISLSLGLYIPVDTPRWQEIAVGLSAAPCSVFSSAVEMGYVACAGEFVRLAVSESSSQIVANPGGSPIEVNQSRFGLLKGIYR